MSPGVEATPLKCKDQVIKVTLAAGDTDTYNVSGTLCSKGRIEGKTLQVLIHGVTYSRVYWDFPYRSRHYSYVDRATDRGYATFNIDRIGSGKSDHPDGNLVTLLSNVHAVHQVIQALRSGSGEVLWHGRPVAFRKVIAVGHSLGSFVSMLLAGLHPEDVDGVVLTGMLHDVNPVSEEFLFSSFYPAFLDGRFGGKFGNFDYFTTFPGTREPLFYYSARTNPTVVEVDESTKETLALGELDSLDVFLNSLVSFQIQDPVLVMVGEFDGLFCGNQVNCSDPVAVQRYEEDFYGPDACLETIVIPGSGHNLNLHKNARSTFSKILSWTDRKVGRNEWNRPRHCHRH